MLYERWVKEWKSALAENFFLRVLCLLLALIIVVSVVFLRGKDRIIIVPPKIEKDVWIESNRVSDSYLEQMGIFFATFACNMSPINAEYNAKVISEHTTLSSRAESRSEIMAQAAYFKKNNVTQSFFPEAVKVDAENKSVIVEGLAIRYVGSVKMSQERASVNIKFTTKDYTLKIDELYLDYPERKLKAIEAKEKTEKKELEKQMKEKRLEEKQEKNKEFIE